MAIVSDVTWLRVAADLALLAAFAANLDHLHLCATAACRTAEDALPSATAAE
jgi:hypothetical protein